MKKKIIFLYVIVIFLLSFIYFSPIKSVQGSSSWEIDDSGNVSYIVDGDTFDVQGVGRIRLADIDCNESGEPGYQEAKDHITSLIYDKDVCLDIDDIYRTDPFGRIVAVTYIRHNSTHFLNVNKDLLDRSLAVISNYDNEFDPSEWTLYVKEIVGNTPTATDDDNDDSDDSSVDYELDYIAGGLIALGVVGGVMGIVVGLAYNSSRKPKARNKLSRKREDYTFPKPYHCCTQCGILLEPNTTFCHNCGLSLQQKSAKIISPRQNPYKSSEPTKEIIKEKKLRYCDKCGSLMAFHTISNLKVMKCVACGKVNALRRVDLDFYYERERINNNREEMIRNWFDQYKKMRKNS